MLKTGQVVISTVVSAAGLQEDASEEMLMDDLHLNNLESDPLKFWDLVFCLMADSMQRAT